MANKKKPKPAAKKKPTPAAKKKPTPLIRKKEETSKPAAEKAHINGKEILRRAVIAVLAVVLVFGMVLSAFSLRGELLQKKNTLVYAGVLQQEYLFPIGFEDEQVREFVRATKRHGQTRAFSYFCNDTLHLESTNTSGFIMFGNPAENDCTLVLTILDGDGRMVYRSDGVKPGKYITQLRPFLELENGTYACTAYVSAYTGQNLDYKCVGVQYSRLNVEVGETG